MKYLFYLSLSVWVLATACNDGEIMGTDLLDNETIQVDFTDTISFTTRNVLGDSVITFRQLTGDNYPVATYMTGNIEDDIFGNTEVTSYFNVTLENEFPSLDSTLIDSVVFSILLDSLGQYGADNVVQDIELGELLFEMVDDTMFSDMVLPFSPIQNYSVNVSHRDSLIINAHVIDSMINIPPQLRLALDPQDWIDLYNIGGTITAENVLARFPGFAIKTRSAEGSLVGMNLLFDNNVSVSNLLFYCTNTNSGEKFIYGMPVGQRRHSAFIHDYDGSQVGASLNSSDSQDIFLQAMAGTNIEIDISEIVNFDSFIINQATIELFALDPVLDNFDPIPSLIALFDDDGVLTPISDSQTQLQTGLETFGGIVEETMVNGMPLFNYNLDITTHLNQFRNGEITNPKIIIISAGNSQIPNRSILFGVNHPEFPARLKLVLTQP